jgi:hypothetical protein
VRRELGSRGYTIELHLQIRELRPLPKCEFDRAVARIPMPYIVRAMSLVPDELRAHLELEIAHYTRLDKLFDYQYQHHEGLTRPQTEVVAGRVSALNDCFY